jgi:hypothetical protein
MFLLLAIIVVLIIVLAVAYQKKWLNKYLPATMQKQGFVGAYGRTPEMQHCLAYSGDATRAPYFNRCTWV